MEKKCICGHKESDHVTLIRPTIATVCFSFGYINDRIGYGHCECDGFTTWTPAKGWRRV